MNAIRGNRRRVADLLAAAIVITALAVVLASGCGGKSATLNEAGPPQTGDRTSYGGDSEPLSAVGDEALQKAASGETGAAGANMALPVVLDASRYLVRTGDMTILVKKGEVGAAAMRVTTLTAGFGGYVMASQVDSAVAGGKPTATITVRVPTRSYEQAIARFSELGEVKTQHTATEDVTGQYVDLQARLTHYRAVEKRLLSFLTKARTIGEALSIQERIDATQLQVEQLSGQLKSLHEQVAYSTLSVAIAEKPEDAAATATGNSFIKALGDSAGLVVAGFEAIIVALGALIPFLLVFGAIGLLVWKGRRWLRRGRRQPSVQA